MHCKSKQGNQGNTKIHELFDPQAFDMLEGQVDLEEGSTPARCWHEDFNKASRGEEKTLSSGPLWCFAVTLHF